MRAPLSWIRDFTPVEGSPDEIARSLSFLGLVVEGMERTGPPLPGIVVARVVGTKPHPGADRIQLVEVDSGDGEALQVCCGAFNMRPGDLVPLATIGAVMPGGLEIGRRKMRGEWSNGMLCSAPEIGLGPERPTPEIMVLQPGSASPGEPVADALGLSADVVFDLEVSPNRSDCFSVAGVARDLAAAMRLPFSLPEPEHRASEHVERANVRVSSDAVHACPRFTGTVIEAVGSVAVPPLVQHRLALAGMRAISPVVDVSNYVMLELGQPNHPYDIDKLGGRGLLVRMAVEGEQIVTLDGSVRLMGPDDLVIADAQGTGVGVAGIMGGAGAEISGSTSTVLLEVASFAPEVISATGKRLGLSSEARTRFERGVDIELAKLAVDRFVELLGPGVRNGEMTDVRAHGPVVRSVRLRTDRANLVLGTELGAEQCAELIAPLGFGVEGSTERPDGAREYDMSVPTWRPDCTREIDLIEEIARIYGYDNIARSVPPRLVSSGGLTGHQKARRLVREVLVGAGADEAWTSSFVPAADLSRAGLATGAALELENPLDQAQGLLRTSLLPGLLRAARSNTERQAGALSLFELGSVFRKAVATDEPGTVEGVHEWEQLGLVALGAGVDAGYAVRVWEVLAGGLGLGAAGLEGTGLEGAERAPRATDVDGWDALHPGRRAAVSISGRTVGVLGELAPEVSRRHGLGGRVAVLLVDLAPLLSGRRLNVRARPVSRYPAADLDMAFVVADEVPAAQLGETVRIAAGDLAESVVLFDVWRDVSLGVGRRSLAFRARLRAFDRTLTDQDVAQVREKVAEAALENHGAILRRA